MTVLSYTDLFGILEECSDPEEPTSPPGDGTVDENLEELGYDSLALLDFAALLERRFGVAIPDGDVTEARTPRALLALVNAGFADAARWSAPAPAPAAGPSPVQDALAVLTRRDRGFTERRMIVPVVAEELFGLVADASRWPVLFPATVHVRQLDRQERAERAEVWESADGGTYTRTLRRVVNADRLHIAFSWDEPLPAPHPRRAARPPYHELAGEWRFRPLVGGGTEVVLRQRYTLDEDGSDAAARAAEAVGCDSARWLAALRRVAGLGWPVAQLLFSVSEEVSLPRPIDEVYARVLASFGQGGGRGRGYLDGSVVVAEPGRWIARKTLDADQPLLGSAELWSFEPVGEGTRATAVHRALIEPAAVRTSGGEADSALSGLRLRVGEELRRRTVEVLDAAWAVR